MIEYDFEDYKTFELPKYGRPMKDHEILLNSSDISKRLENNRLFSRKVKLLKKKINFLRNVKFKM